MAEVKRGDQMIAGAIKNLPPAKPVALQLQIAQVYRTDPAVAGTIRLALGEEVGDAVDRPSPLEGGDRFGRLPAEGAVGAPDRQGELLGSAGAATGDRLKRALDQEDQRVRCPTIRRSTKTERIPCADGLQSPESA